MKKLLHYIKSFILILPLLGYTQFTQLGADIDGETTGDASGHSVSLSGDGSRMAIGAPQFFFSDDGRPYNVGMGQVRIFEYVGGSWTQLGADIDGGDTDEEGISVSISSDGKRVATAARGYDGVNGLSIGRVRIFEYIDGNWTRLGADIEGEKQGDGSGTSISLSSDGNRVAIGARSNDGAFFDPLDADSGQVRVFEYIGNSWTQLGADIDGEAVKDASGASVSLSADGNQVAIGATNNDGNGQSSGHVRVFEYIGGNWTQLGADINGEADEDFSGFSVSLSSDGKRVAIGAANNDGNGQRSGHVRIFEYMGGTWTQLGADIDGEAAGDLLGLSVSLSSDGKRVAIGAVGNDGNGNNSGHVRVFEYIDGNWTQLSVDIEGEMPGDGSGIVSLSSDGKKVAIGAPQNDGNGINSGHVRVFENTPLIISSFMLVDADTDTDIVSIQEGHILSVFTERNKKVNIRVNAIGDVTRVRVDFELSGPVNRKWTERHVPFALFGDINGDYNGAVLPAGKYHLRASAIHELGGHLNTIEVNFFIPDALGIVALEMTTLIENKFVGATRLYDNRVFNEVTDRFLGDPRTIVALVNEGFTGSVEMTIEGPPSWGNSSRIENIAPYTMFGDRTHLPLEDAHRDYNFRDFTYGTYRITATPFEMPDGKGAAGKPLTISIRVEENNPISFEFRNETFISPFEPLEDGKTYSSGNNNSTLVGNVSIRAITSLNLVGSMVLRISGPINHTQIENSAPYSLFGDIDGVFNSAKILEGDYTLTATPYSETDGKGMAGLPQTISFSVDLLDNFPVTIIRLFNVNTGLEIADLFYNDNVIIDINDTPTDNATIFAAFECDLGDCPGSMFLQLEGPVTTSRIENIRPYTIFGDLDGVINGRTFPVGNYTFSVTPYSDSNGSGTPSDTVTVNFQIIDSANNLALKTVLYPNPVNSSAFIKTTDDNPVYKIEIFDFSGNKLKELNHLRAEQAIDVSELQPGMYFLLIQAGEEVFTKKLIVQ